jgi:hypothetical protein
VTTQWTTESGTGSSAANAWISACSTTTAGYPRWPARARRIAVSIAADSAAAAAVRRWAARRASRAASARAAACPAPLRAARPALRLQGWSSAVAGVAAGLATWWRVVAVRGFGGVQSSRWRRLARNAAGRSMWSGHDQPRWRISRLSASVIWRAVQAVGSRVA